MNQIITILHYKSYSGGVPSDFLIGKKILLEKNISHDIFSLNRQK